MMDSSVKQQVREFYDQVGWTQVSQGVYQNAHYEDLRPVSREYIHRCHQRVSRHLQRTGRYLLDAGSGPIQYPEYLEYSRGYQRRVCADISILALQEARKRIGEHGLFVVCDIAALPFEPQAFDGAVSLHTIHHLPEEEHLQAYSELFRVLAPRSSAVVVNGWPSSRLMGFFEPLIRVSMRLRRIVSRQQGKTPDPAEGEPAPSHRKQKKDRRAADGSLKGTFTNRHDVAWIKETVGARMPLEVWVWRSVSVRFLRNLIHPWNGGRLWLRLLFWLEERFPHYFGEIGQYPLIVIRKP